MSDGPFVSLGLKCRLVLHVSAEKVRTWQIIVQDVQ